MSISISKNLLTKDQKIEISEKLKIAGAELYNVIDGEVILPFAFGLNLYENSKLKLEEEMEPIICNIKLRDEQQEIYEKFNEILTRGQTVILSLPTGFGKTILAIAAAAKYGLKTLVIVHRTNLAAQWKKAIDEFCPGAGAEIMKAGRPASIKNTFFICGPRSIRARMDFIKFLIVDEVHLIMTKSGISCFENIFPLYAIALSATPYRNDEAGAFINIYFGHKHVSLLTKKEHLVNKILFRIKYDIKYIKMADGKEKVDWNYILKQQSENAARNNLIINIIEENPDKNFIVLCKRKQHILSLYNLLRERELDAYMFYGSDKTYTNCSRVLLTTVSKSGVGFDDPRLNAMILAADVENYFIQYLGRVFRSQDVIPEIYDIVDTNFIMQKHWKTRMEIYERFGGKIFIKK